MSKPIIGLTPLYDTQENKLWMRQNYLNAVISNGGIPLILPLIDDESEISNLAEICDGFLFTGLTDVHPKIFGEETMQYCGEINEMRDNFEITLLKEVIKLDKPVFGICRGIQLINAALGGTLYQDIKSEVKEKPIMHYQHRPYDVGVHSVEIIKNTPLYDILKTDEIMVDSMHHQAVKEIAPSLKCAAKSNDNLAECLYMPGKKFFMAVQWHPEYMQNKGNDNKKLIRAFIDSSKI